MHEVQDKLNNTVDGEFISEEKTQSIFGTTMARASVVQSLFESEVSKDYKSSNIEKYTEKCCFLLANLEFVWILSFGFM